MHWLRLTQDGLWILSSLLEFVLVVAMLRKKVVGRFPFFFAYVTADTCFTAIMFALARLLHVPGSFWSQLYFPRLALTTALQFPVVWEVFEHLFSSYSFLNRFGRPFFRIALLAFFLLSIAAAAMTQPHGAYRSMQIMYLLRQTSSILLVGLLGSLFVFSAWFGLSWRSFVFGIALGMGSDAAVNLAASAISEYRGFSGNIYLNLLRLASSDVSAIIWIFYLFMPDRKAGNGNMSNIQPSDLDDWSKELRKLS